MMSLAPPGPSSDYFDVKQARAAMDKYQGFVFEGTDKAYPDDFHLQRGLDIDWDKDDRVKRNIAYRRDEPRGGQGGAGDEGGSAAEVVAGILAKRKAREDKAKQPQDPSELEDEIARLRSIAGGEAGETSAAAASSSSSSSSISREGGASAGSSSSDSTLALIANLKQKMAEEEGEEVPMDGDEDSSVFESQSGTGDPQVSEITASSSSSGSGSGGSVSGAGGVGVHIPQKGASLTGSKGDSDNGLPAGMVLKKRRKQSQSGPDGSKKTQKKKKKSTPTPSAEEPMINSESSSGPTTVPPADDKPALDSGSTASAGAAGLLLADYGDSDDED